MHAARDTNELFHESMFLHQFVQIRFEWILEVCSGEGSRECFARVHPEASLITINFEFIDVEDRVHSIPEHVDFATRVACSSHAGLDVEDPDAFIITVDHRLLMIPVEDHPDDIFHRDLNILDDVLCIFKIRFHFFSFVRNTKKLTLGQLHIMFLEISTTQSSTDLKVVRR